MLTDIGEYVVGAYLKMVEGCDFVDYNVRAPGGGIEGLGELDVLGLDMANKRAYLCEVTTHIRGLNYGGNEESVSRIVKKHERQKWYAQNYLTNFEEARFSFWSPYVPVGYITEALEPIDGLDLVINSEYAARIEKLKELAESNTHDTRNPFFRMLQILQHVRT
jgi:hypothetical protein